MRNRVVALSAIAVASLTLTGCASTGGTSAAAPEMAVKVVPNLTPDEAANTITGPQTQARIAFLASDEMRGRNTPSPELEVAADYLATEFASFGLQPAGDAGGFLQRYPYTQVKIDRGTIELEVISGAEVTAWTLGSDFFAIPSVVSSAQAEAVFVGPIEAVAEGLPDEVEGRIVLMTTPPNLGLETLGALKAAAAAGAAGLVFIVHPAIPEEAIAQITTSLLGGGIPVQSIASAGLRHDAARPVFEAEGLDLDALAAGETTEPVVLTGIEFLLQAVTSETEHHPPNVVAILPGSDPVLAAEYVVFSAHFDHVGVGAPDASGDSIYNGADDDASGTSVMVEVAQAFASLETPPARSLIFLAVSGEEKGLLGSLHFSSHPTVPIENVVANINMDMVGRNAPDTVIQVGGEHSTLGPLATEIAASTPGIGLVVVPDPDPSEGAFYRSDHVAFVKHEIPSIFVTSWLHDDYHQPSDEPDTIDGDKAARIGKLVFHLGYAIANSAEPPAWTDEGLVTVREALKQLPF